MNGFIRIIYLYFLGFIICTSIYLGLFSVSSFVKFDFLFLKSGINLIIATILSLLIFLYLRKKKFKIFEKMVWQDFALICVINIFINWFIYGLIPFNVSRSVSIILLKYLYDNTGHNITKAQIDEFIKNKYFNEYDAVGIRLSEQIAAGNVGENGGVYFITPKGIFVANTFLSVSKFYNLNNNFLEK